MSGTKNPVLGNDGSSANMAVVSVSQRDLPGEFSKTSINTIDDSASLTLNSTFSNRWFRCGGAIGFIRGVVTILESVTNSDVHDAFVVRFTKELTGITATAGASSFVTVVIAIAETITEPILRNAFRLVSAFLLT